MAQAILRHMWCEARRQADQNPGRSKSPRLVWHRVLATSRPRISRSGGISSTLTTGCCSAGSLASQRSCPSCTGSTPGTSCTFPSGSAKSDPSSPSRRRRCLTPLAVRRSAGAAQHQFKIVEGGIAVEEVTWRWHGAWDGPGVQTRVQSIVRTLAKAVNNLDFAVNAAADELVNLAGKRSGRKAG